MQQTTQGSLHWLIRKNGPSGPAVSEDGTQIESSLSSVTVLGPYETSQVREMVEQGMLDADDELCPENSYWFSLHEAAEVKRFLGIENLIIRRSSDDEATQPDLAGERTQPQMEVSAPEPEPEPLAMPEMEVESNVSGNPEATGVIKINRPAKPQPASAPAAAASVPAPAAAAMAAPAPARPAPVPGPTASPKPIITTAKAPTAAELKSRYPRMAPPRATIFSNPTATENSSILGMEKSRFWGILLVAFFVLAGIGVLWVIRSLRA